MNPKLQKVNEEIEKLRQKVTNYQSRLRELERQKTEMENLDIIALVRNIGLPPEELQTFARAFMEQREHRAVPDMEDNPSEDTDKNKTTETEDLIVEN